MCGICGFVGITDKGLLIKMGKKLKHRGPDGLGYFTDKKVGLCNRRLSIIDLKTGKQPMFNEDGSVVVVFNGEIYNYKELRGELEKKHSFHSDSDTEVIVHLYEELGEGFVDRLDGMFAIALYDQNKKKLFLFRDRLGIKPIYYYYHDGVFLFASEIKALLEYKGIERKIDGGAIRNCLIFRFEPGSRTGIKGLMKLPPGHKLVFHADSVKVTKYWQLGIKEADVKDSTKECKNLLEEAVEKRLVSDVPLGAFLSGGLDSSSIVAFMNSMMEKPVKTFTVGFGDRGDEFKYAEKVAKFLDTEHHEQIISMEDIRKNLEKIIYHMDEPVLDPAMIPTYFMSKLARKHVKVVLVGEGADEIFAGYTSYKIASPYLKIAPESLRSGFYWKKTAVFKKDEINGLCGLDKISKVSVKKHKGIGFLNRLLMFDIENVLPNYQLMRVDNMTMANSLEARVPFLDTKMVEFSMKLPENLKLRGFGGKYILRKAVSGMLPGSVVKQRKRTFFVPMERLFREFGDVYEEVLKGSKIFNYNFINKRIYKNPYKMWMLANLQMWCDKIQVEQ